MLILIVNYMVSLDLFLVIFFILIRSNFCTPNNLNGYKLYVFFIILFFFFSFSLHCIGTTKNAERRHWEVMKSHGTRLIDVCWS